MPDRIIRASILSSDRVNSVSWGSEVFYRRLMSVADDFGRYDGRLSILRAHLFALKLDRVSESDIGKWIRECDDAGLVRIYTVDEKQYVEILRFNQRTRAQISRWPNPPSIASGGPQIPADVGHPRSETETETNVGAEVVDRQATYDLAETIYDAYPRKVAKQDALKAIRKVFANHHESAVLLLEKVKQYAAAVEQWSEKDKQFIPHPSTWFNRGHYEDDPKTWERVGHKQGWNQ